MNNRIKKVRTEMKLTQDVFANRISLTRNYISLIEKGERIPSDRTISDICREFRVNEMWLRTGEGDMFQELPPEDEVAAVVSNVLEDIHCDNSIYTLIKELLLKYDRLDPKSKKVIDEYADDIINGYIKKREER